MDNIQILYLDRLTNKLLEIKDTTIPIILNNSGKGNISLVYKNIGTSVLSNIVVSASGIPAGANLTSAISDIYSVPITSDYTSGISYSAIPVLLELYPGESFKLYINTDYSTNIGISFSDFSLDLAFDTSLISLSNLEAFYEFTEPYNSTVAYSSYNTLNAVVYTGSRVPILRGIGGLFLRKDNDKIVINSMPAITQMTFMIKSIIENLAYDVPIVSVGNLEIGIDAARMPYVEIGGERTTSVKSLYDYNQDAVLGFSFSSSKDASIYIDGVKSETSYLNPVAAEIPLSILLGDICTVGRAGTRQFIGDIDSIAMYSDIKESPYHTNYYRIIR